MLNSERLCQRIKEIYPDIGECGIDVKVTYDENLDRWTVYLTRDNKRLKTFLEPGDAELCMQGSQCVNLSIEINQLKDSIDRMPAR